jgi:plastocyanin
MPSTVTIAAGMQVQWTNQDGTAHTVTADDTGFHSDTLDHGQTFSQTFSAPGAYSYHCSIHPFMKGKIVVQ